MLAQLIREMSKEPGGVSLPEVLLVARDLRRLRDPLAKAPTGEWFKSVFVGQERGFSVGQGKLITVQRFLAIHIPSLIRFMDLLKEAVRAYKIDLWHIFYADETDISFEIGHGTPVRTLCAHVALTDASLMHFLCLFRPLLCVSRLFSLQDSPR